MNNTDFYIRWLAMMFAVVIAIAVVFIGKEPEHTTEIYTVQPGDTFWSIYMNQYSDYIEYQKALYYFKEDNNMQKYELVEGQEVILRRYE